MFLVGGVRKLGPDGPEGPLSLVVEVVRSRRSLKSRRRVLLGRPGGLRPLWGQPRAAQELVRGDPRWKIPPTRLLLLVSSF